VEDRGRIADNRAIVQPFGHPLKDFLLTGLEVKPPTGAPVQEGPQVSRPTRVKIAPLRLEEKIEPKVRQWPSTAAVSKNKIYGPAVQKGPWKWQSGFKKPPHLRIPQIHCKIDSNVLFKHLPRGPNVVIAARKLVVQWSLKLLFFEF
jgi:hypothetical protein